MSVPAFDTAATIVRPSVRNPLGGRRIRGVLFDLDGTLYRQGPMRRRMAIELVLYSITRPFGAADRLRMLRAYRHAQERLRGVAVTQSPLARQLELAAAASGCSVADVERTVTEWMFERPLRHIAGCRAAGLHELLTFLNTRDIATGLLSDYPADAKLGALGVADRFSLVLCSSDREIGRLKPHPRGFLLACERWGLDPAEVLMVGDRMEVDAAGARAAGMPCVIVGGRASDSKPSRISDRSFDGNGVLRLPSLERLLRVLDDDRR